MAEQREATVDVWIDGELMEDFEDRVLELEVEERSTDASSFRILMSMGPNEDEEWVVIDDPRFQLMRRVTIAFGVGLPDEQDAGEKRVLFDGYITSIEPYFGPQRVPDSTFEISGLDASCLMHFEARVREWSGKSDGQIVRAIYADYGFDVDVPDTAPTRQHNTASLLQRCTDAEFVRMLARRNGFECYVEHSGAKIAKGSHPGKQIVGHFHAPRLEASPQPDLELLPRSHPSLIELRARWDSHRPTRIVSRHIDMRSRKILEASRDTPKLHKLGKYTRADLIHTRLGELKRVATLDPVEIQRGMVPHHETELNSFVFADYLENNWLAEASGKVQGLRYSDIVRARRPIGVAGGGQLVNGPWYVRSARHVFRRGAPTEAYEVEVELVRNALGPVESSSRKAG